MNIDFSSLLTGVSLTAVVGWIGSFLSLRKDDRAVQIEQVTKERTKWRNDMRKLSADIAALYGDGKKIGDKDVLSKKAKLITSLNPKDIDDFKIICSFNELFSDNPNDESLDIFLVRLSVLLKHDWERVKWECTPIYFKILLRFSSDHNEWRDKKYRKLLIEKRNNMNPENWPIEWKDY